MRFDRRLLAAALAVALLSVVACAPSAAMEGDLAVPTASPAAGGGATTVAPAEGATPSAAAPSSPTPIPGGVEHDGERAMEHARALAEGIGPRVAGTRGEAAALAYVRERLEGWGYHVEVLPFTFPDPFRQGVVRLDGAEIEARPMAGSAAGRVSAAAVDVGLGRPEDLEGRDLRGKVAVARRGEIRFGEKLANVQAAGAVALVVVNDEPGPLLGDLGREANLPALGVSGADGAALLAAARAGQLVTVELADPGPSRSANVLAAPAPGARCSVIVGAHHDTVPAAPGANDNASGTANVLELARAFAADGLDEGLCFATFGAEESGLHGSRALVTSLQERGALPRAMVNLDVTGGGDAVRVIGSEELVALALDVARRQGIPARAAEMPAAWGSDHQSFARAGVPVVFFTSGEFAAIHTPEDTVEGLQPAGLDRVGDLALATIAALLDERRQDGP